MPLGILGISAGTAALIVGSAVATTATGIYASKKQGDAAERAGEIGERSANEAIAFEREKEARRKEEWDLVQSQEKARHDAEQAQVLSDRNELRARYNADEARLEPYRSVGFGALSQLAQRAGIEAPTRVQPRILGPEATDDFMPPPDTTPTNQPLPVVKAAVEPDRARMGADRALPSSEIPAISPEAYQRIASSPDALAAMSPTELQTFQEQLKRLPLGAIARRQPAPRSI